MGLKRRRQVDWVFGKIQIVTAVAVVAIGASLKADVSRFNNVPLIASTLNWMQESAWAVVVAGPIIVALLQLLRHKFGSP